MERPIEDSRVEYWLNSISSKVKTAPVVVVGTHLDGLPKQYRESTLPGVMRDIKTKYKQIFQTLDLAFLTTSAKTGEGFQELKDFVEKVRN